MVTGGSMKTEQEIREKIKQLKNLYACIKATGRDIGETVETVTIRTLEWVLEEE